MPAVLSLAAAALLAAADPAPNLDRAPVADLAPAASSAQGAADPSGDDADPAPAPTEAGPSEPAATQGGNPAGQAGAAEAAARAHPGRSWFALPVVFWLPETKLGVAGAAGLHFHVAPGAADSNAFLVAGYTMLGQSTVDLASDVVLRNGTLLTGRLRFAYYPDTFYGIGPHTTLDQREENTRRFAEAQLTAEFPIPRLRALRIGPRLHARSERITDATPGGLVETGQVVGADGFDAIGLGFQATFDTRDNTLWSTRGAYVQAWYLDYPTHLVGHGVTGFYRGSAEARWFAPLGKGRVLGLAAWLEHADARTPFSIMPKIGSTRYLRGIRDGRFRDAIAWAGQAELRVPLASKIAGALFGAFGDVTPSLADQAARTVKFAGGAGLRYRLTEQGANVRADAAISKEGGVEIYVLLLEAF